MSGNGFKFQLFALQRRETSSLLDTGAGNIILPFLLLAKCPENLGHKAKTSSPFSSLLFFLNYMLGKKKKKRNVECLFHQPRLCAKSYLLIAVIGPFIGINLFVQAFRSESFRNRVEGGTSSQAIHRLGKS